MKINYTEKEISKVAQVVLEDASSKILLFYGPMGVGKTTLIKELSRELGVRETVSSPSFSIVNEYEIPGGLIFHFDFYRIENPQEALDLGVDDYLNSGNFVFIEWPEKIDALLPEDAVILQLERNEDESRTLRMKVK